MRTESKKTLKFGFILTEAELRRIVGTMEDQLKKISNIANVRSTFDLKYRNGALATTSSLDEVLSQENIGSAQVVYLKIKCAVGDDNDNSISMQFQNLELVPESNASPIEFAVKGEERDWTFVTSSLLEERALKVRRRPLARLIGAHTEWEHFVYVLALLSGMMFFFLIASAGRNSMFLTENLNTTHEPPPSPTPKEALLSEQLEAKVQAEKIKDPIQALIIRDRLLEKMSEEREAREREWRAQLEEFNRGRLLELERRQSIWRRADSLSGILLMALIPPLLIYLLRTFLVLYYPPYNFSWGDYLDVFRKKEAVRKFIVVVVFIGVIVSFVGGVLANFSKIGR